MVKLFRFIFSVLAVFGSALVGNWLGSLLRAELTGEVEKKLRFVHTNDEGETTIAANIVVTNFLPAVWLGMQGRPNPFWAFVAGVAASLFLSDEYEERFLSLLSK